MHKHIRLLETIKIVNGKALHLSFHQKRMDEARLQLWQQKPTLLLKNIIIPQTIGEGVIKWRVVYGVSDYKSEFLPYSPKNIKSLKLIEANDLIYPFKYENRELLNCLHKESGNCDDVLIIKNGEITDTTFANIVFFDGSKWFTPKNPLLYGTQRARLIEEKRIAEKLITIDNLHLFSSFKIINAMIDFEESPIIDMKWLVP